MEGQPAGDVRDYSVQHSVPQPFGGEEGDGLAPLPVLRVRADWLRRPVTPGLPPLTHPRLPPPEAERLELLLPAGEEDDGPGLFGLQTDMQQALAAAAAAGAPIPLAQRLDPLYPFILFLALGVGSSYIGLDAVTRYTLLWTVLLALGTFLTLVDSPRTAGEMSSASLGWGASFGLIFSLPLFILMRPVLASMVAVLFPGLDPPSLFLILVLLAPLAETLFFRGALLERRGFAASVLGAGVMSIVLYWPAASGETVYLIAVAVLTTVLAGIYGFVRSRYGLSAALVCAVTVNVLLLFLPAVLG